MTIDNAALAEYSDTKRLAIYKMLTAACTHLFSKGKLQEDKFMAIATTFADIALHDPIFMAHLTAWAAKKDSKDLKVLSIFFNSLNDANGTPFFKGSKTNKPNFRETSYALLQELDPHLALRVLELCHNKFQVKDMLNQSRHFTTGMKTAMRKYLRYRESNEDMLRGIKRSGLSKKFMQIYRLTRSAPSREAAAILHWKQKLGEAIEMEKNLPDFTKMEAAKIAEYLENTKVSPIVAMSVIPADKMTAKVAKAMLQNCSGNQSIILYNWFSRNGFLDVKAIKELFKDKVSTATTAVDRIDTLTKNADAEDKREMAAVRSQKRKASAKTAEIGKMFMHIDASGSMNAAIEFAKNHAATLAECLDNPAENFRWGLFRASGTELKVPSAFTKEDFYQALYGVDASGSTDCIALYPQARRFGAEVDVYVTDQGHNVGTISKRIEEFHQRNPECPKPKAAVIIDFSDYRHARERTVLQEELARVGIPVAIIKPDALKESALVAQSVRTALIGELAIIEEILATKLPTLPKWWSKVKAVSKVEEKVVAE